MKYYYIYNNKQIKVRNIAVDTAVFKQYVEMTAEQKAFYLANPNAGAREVINCKLNERPSFAILTLDDIKANAIKEVSALSLNTKSSIIPDYKVTNALMSLMNITNNIYSNEESQAVLQDANNIGVVCRSMFYDIKDLINGAYSEDEVRDIVLAAYDNYDTILKENI